jgi:hypothetical protein
MQIIDEAFTLSDEQGTLYCSSGRLHLKLKSEGGRVRNIGVLSLHETDYGFRRVYVKDEKEEDIFQKTNAWSIYHEILQRVDTVLYQTKSKIYYVSKKQALKHGKYLFFKQTGIEKKIYLPLEYWEISCRHTGKLLQEAKF